MPAKGSRGAAPHVESNTCEHMVDWGAHAAEVTGTRGWAAPSNFAMADISVRTISDPVLVPPGTQLAKVTIQRAFLDARDPCSLSNAMSTIVHHNPSVPIFQFFLSHSDRSDLDQVLSAKCPPTSNQTMAYYIGNANHSLPGTLPVKPMFSVQKPKAPLMSAHAYTRHKHTRRFFSTPDPHSVLPVYSLPSKGLVEWEAEVHGLTTPTAYYSDSLIPIPVQSPSPLIAPNDPIVEWNGLFVENGDLASLPQLGHVRVQNLGADHVDSCRAEVAAFGADKWEAIFDLVAPTPSPFRNDGRTRTMVPGKAVAAPPSAAKTMKGHRLPALEAAAASILKTVKAATALPLDIMSMGYIRATGDRLQAWHRDHLRAARPEGGHAFSLFLALSACEEGEASHFVAHSGGGLPRPWMPIPMPMGVGDVWAISSDVIHAGGFPKKDGPPRDMVFFGLATWPLDFGFPCPVRVPAHALRVVPGVGPVKCGHEGCNATQLPSECCDCEKRLCATHGGEVGLCSACANNSAGTSVSTPAAIPAPVRLPSSADLPCAADCWFPAGVSSMYTVHAVDAKDAQFTAHKSFATDAKPADADMPCAPADCPLGAYLHEEEFLPVADAACRLVLHTPPGVILVVNRGQFGGVIVNPPEADREACRAFWFTLAGHRQPVDPSELMEMGGIVKLSETGELSCTCHQVPTQPLHVICPPMPPLSTNDTTSFRPADSAGTP